MKLSALEKRILKRVLKATRERFKNVPEAYTRTQAERDAFASLMKKLETRIA